MKPHAAQQRPGGSGPPPTDTGASKAASSATDIQKRDAAEGKKQKRKRDASEKLSKTTTFSPSVEQSQMAAEEREKKKRAPAAKGFVATLLSINPLAFVPLPRARVDSLEVIRKRIREKEEPPAPYPLETILGVCLTVFLAIVLVAYMAIGISEPLH